jgi:hypothetical protein
MRRIATATKVADKFGAGKAGFTDGNAVAGIPATDLEGDWFDHVQEEIAGVIETAGLILDPANRAQLLTALRSGALVYGIDTGAANACAVAFTPAITALIDGMALWFKAKNANTGGTTLNVNGLGASSIIGAGNNPLQGGEIVANGRCQVIWNAAANSWVLIECTGGALQVAPSTQSGHAINLGQLAAVLAANGYVKIPVSVAGVQRTLIVQWVAPTVPASSTSTVTLPIPWPNVCLAATCGSMVGGMTAGLTPGFATDVGSTTVNVQNTYSGSSLKVGVLMIGW